MEKPNYIGSLQCSESLQSDKMTSEKTSARFVWRDFQNNIKESVQELQVSEKFCDVTLVCEDGEHVSAHRAVLASGSTVLRNLFKKTAERPDDLVFLTGVSREEVETLLHWLYTGQVILERVGLASFLGLARSLAVKGVKQLEKVFKNLKKIQIFQKSHQSH